MSAYYNEIDPYAAQWLRNLIDKGLIAPGVVDERSIEDVKPNELMGYTQCHFFAGIGVWSLALRRAGWPDNRPIWTGSCPCQPFSSAGKSAGFTDERHLWPYFHWLIQECKPAIVIGEQVEAAIKRGWWDLVASDAEALGYAAAGSVIPASAVGAPHIRSRLFFVLQLGAPTNSESEPRNGHKEMHKMSSDKADNGVLPGEALSGLLSNRLQGVLGSEEEGQTGPAKQGREKEAYKRAEREARANGAGLLQGTERTVSGERANTVSTFAGKEEELAFQFRRIRSTAYRAGESERVRDDGNCPTEEAAERVQHSLARPSRPKSGVCVRQCESDLLCAELCARDVGRRQASGDGSNIKREETIDAAKYAVQPQAQDGPHALRSAYPSNSGVGAPHIRDRNYWMGYSSIQGLQAREPAAVERTRGREERGAVEQPGRTPGGLADTHCEPTGRDAGTAHAKKIKHGSENSNSDGPRDAGDPLVNREPADATNGFWRDADWLLCRDDKWRPVESGSFPLADRATSRVGRLRAYGNAINAEAATVFIQSVMESLNTATTSDAAP